MTTTNTPRMMPGQEPYTPAELDTLHALVHDGAAGDPGETSEPPTGVLTFLVDGRCANGGRPECDHDIRYDLLHRPA